MQRINISLLLRVQKHHCPLEHKKTSYWDLPPQFVIPLQELDVSVLSSSALWEESWASSYKLHIFLVSAICHLLGLLYLDFSLSYLVDLREVYSWHTSQVQRWSVDFSCLISASRGHQFCSELKMKLQDCTWHFLPAKLDATE